MTDFCCFNCGYRSEVADDLGGQLMPCPSCKHMVLITPSEATDEPNTGAAGGQGIIKDAVKCPHCGHDADRNSVRCPSCHRSRRPLGLGVLAILGMIGATLCALLGMVMFPLSEGIGALLVVASVVGFWVNAGLLRGSHTAWIVYQLLLVLNLLGTAAAFLSHVQAELGIIFVIQLIVSGGFLYGLNTVAVKQFCSQKTQADQDRAEAEKKAGSALTEAIRLETRGQLEAALAKYTEIVTQWPNTSSARDADQCTQSVRNKIEQQKSLK